MDPTPAKKSYPVRRLMLWLRFKRLCGQLALVCLGLLILAYAFWLVLPLDEMVVNWSVPAEDYSGDDWMAVLGDSSVTGAAAHPSLRATWPVFRDLAVDLVWKTRREQHLAPNLQDFIAPEHFGVHVPLDVTRVFYAPSESTGWNLPLLNVRAKAALKLDNEEYSFGYLVGRRLGYDGRRIIFAGQDGAKVDQLAIQTRRLFALRTRTLPPLALVSFVANDMCDPKHFAATPQEFGARFRETVRTQFADLAKLPPNAKGTRILYLAPLDLANVLSSPELLGQKINVDVDLVTCGELRNGGVASSWLGRPIEKILAGECPALLGPGDRTERLDHARALQEEQVRVLDQEIAAFAKIAPATLKLELARSPRQATFHMGDLANDCFHPGIGGHTRIANALLANEFRQPVAPVLGVSESEEQEP